MKHCIDEKLKPDAFFSGLDRIPFAALHRRGFRLVLLDWDNTLVPHGAREADEHAKACLGKIKQLGMACWILSNAAKSRGRQYEQSVDVPVWPMAGKPSPKAVHAICEKTGVSLSQTVLVGDQMFTDIWCAKRAGCHAVLVQPRFAQEPLHLKAKRLLERPLYRRFHLCCSPVKPQGNRHKEETT